MSGLFLLVLLLQSISCYCQVSFTIRRFEDGDEVESQLTSADYCSAIRGYLDGSQCKCEYRLTFSLDHQRCIAYYNAPRFRFSRAGLRADVSVSVVNIAVDTTDSVEQYALRFMASPDTALPIAQGLGNTPLPTGCSISSLEFNTLSGWAANNFSGFTLVERNSASYLEINRSPAEGVELFHAQFVRLNITCPNNVAGSLMFKFGGSQTFNTDVCEPNPCENSATCIPSGNSFVCNCTDGFTGVLCQSVNYCATDPCQNDGFCANGLGTHLCICREEFASEFCDTTTDDNCTCSNDTSDRTCLPFLVIRQDRGDRVYTPLSSVEYCSDIRAYCPDGSCSYCQCEFRLTYRHDLQRCDDYYDDCLLRFSRLALDVDTGVSTVDFIENDEEFEITFEATSHPHVLPIVQGTANNPLPSDCIVASLAVNRANGWRTVNHGGFNLNQNDDNTFLQINGTLSLGIPFFNNELVRLNITCQETSYGCLPMKFKGTGDSKNFTCTPTNFCSPNPCQNGGICNDTIDGYSCTCAEDYFGDNCTNNCPCLNGGTCRSGTGGSDVNNVIFCICPERFTGDRCEVILIDECASSPCINGTCIDQFDGYICVCNEGYTGQNCSDFNECSIEDPCANGVCVNTIGSFMCACEPGYTGIYCGEAICTDPCNNGGTCIDPDVCLCPEAFEGDTCENATGVVVSGQATGDDDDTSQTVGAAVGASVGLVIAIVGTVAAIIIAMIVYTKYYSKKPKPNIEEVAHMDNPTYEQIQQPNHESGELVTNNGNEVAATEHEPVYDEVRQGAQDNGDAPP